MDGDRDKNSNRDGVSDRGSDSDWDSNGDSNGDSNRDSNGDSNGTRTAIGMGGGDGMNGTSIIIKLDAETDTAACAYSTVHYFL